MHLLTEGAVLVSSGERPGEVLPASHAKQVHEQLPCTHCRRPPGSQPHHDSWEPGEVAEEGNEFVAQRILPPCCRSLKGTPLS